VKAEYQGYQLR